MSLKSPVLRIYFNTASCLTLLLLIFSGLSVFGQRPQILIQTGHDASVWSMAFSTDGRYLASGSLDKTVKIWDVATGTEISTLDGHPERVNFLAFSPDGRHLASETAGKPIQVWDLETGRERHRLAGMEPWVFSPDGKLLISKGLDNKILFWSIATGETVQVVENVELLALNPTGKTAAVKGPNKTVRILSLPSKEQISEFQAKAEPAAFTFEKEPVITFSPDGKLLAFGSDEGVIRIWDVYEGKDIFTLPGESSKVTRFIEMLAFSPNGRRLAAIIWDGNQQLSIIKYWDMTTGTLRHTVTRKRDGVSEFLSMAFSPDSKYLACGRRDKRISLLEVEADTDLLTLRERSESLTAMDVSSDGKSFASGYGSTYTSDLGRLKLWSIGGGIARTLPVVTDSFDDVAFSPDGKSLAAVEWNYYNARGEAKESWIELWDTSEGRMSGKLPTVFNGHQKVAFSPDGKILASGGANYSEGVALIKLWDRNSYGKPREFNWGDDSVRSISFSPDSKTLAVGKKDEIKLLDVRTGIASGPFQGSHPVAFSPDGCCLVSGSRTGRAINLWKLGSSVSMVSSKLGEHTDEVFAVAFSPDGKMLASSSSNETKLWDILAEGVGRARSTGSPLPGGHLLAFSADGKLLMIGGADRRIRVWEVSGEDGKTKELASLISIDEKEWLVVTPDGLFDGSPAAWKNLLWRFSPKTFDVLPVEAFFNEFYYPGLLTEIFTGLRPKAREDISQKDRRQPTVLLRSTIAQPPDKPVAVTQVELKIAVTEAPRDSTHPRGSGVKDLRLFRNGSLVWRSDSERKSNRDMCRSDGSGGLVCNVKSSITAGQNLFTAYAFNSDDIKSADATLEIKGDKSLERKGMLYVLAVGVNVYENENYNLSFAVADAQEFSAEMRRQQLEALPSELRRYKDVEIVLFYNSQAKKADILQAIRRIAAKAKPEDVVMIYFAGHGKAIAGDDKSRVEQGRYYLIPHDMGYRGPLVKFEGAILETIKDNSISDRDLEREFEKVDVSQILLVIDACNSGEALESEEWRRGPMNSKGLAQLAYEKGMYILTASQGYQAAKESSKLGHGFLTYALIVEGLKQGLADDEPRNGEVLLREWLDYATRRVPGLQLEKEEGCRRLRSDIECPSKEKDELTRQLIMQQEKQRPRVFYRRETEARPLVVGVKALSQ